MLSKPALESSPGRSVAASTGMSSRSRTAFAYSARFKRCSAGAPGLGAARAAASSEVSSQPTSASTRGLLGPRLAGRRHQVPAQLADRRLPHLGICCDVGTIDAIEREVAGELRVVVAADAIAVDERPVIRLARGALPMGVVRRCRREGDDAADRDDRDEAHASARRVLAPRRAPRAARSSPACVRRRRLRGTRPRPSAAPSGLPCRRRRGARRSRRAGE